MQMRIMFQIVIVFFILFVSSIKVISLLLERYGLEDLAERIVFIAGHQVTTDPLAIPFSKGRNLICIHSKKHIQNPPEQFAQKQAQNIASIKTLNELAAKGGNIFWVAPSGGRDRPSPENGEFAVAPFDNKVVSMFEMIGRQSKRVSFVNHFLYDDVDKDIILHYSPCIFFLWPCSQINLFHHQHQLQVQLEKREAPSADKSAFTSFLNT